jgi:hypothetical protein
LENIHPPPPGGGISADVIWGNVREKERKGKKKEERGKELRKWVIKR